MAERHPEAAVIVPPRSTAVPSETAKSAPTQRDRHLQCIAEHVAEQAADAALAEVLLALRDPAAGPGLFNAVGCGEG